MAILTTRVLASPTGIGRTRALALRGDGRFARLANMTGGEALMPLGQFIVRNKPAFVVGGIAIAMGTISLATISSCATKMRIKPLPPECQQFEVVNTVTVIEEIEWVRPPQPGYLDVPIRRGDHVKKIRTKTVEEAVECAKAMLRQSGIDPDTVSLPIIRLKPHPPTQE